MINFNSKILLYSKPTDMRKSIDGLSILISNKLNLNPTDEVTFVFFNKAKNKIKILWWDTNKFILLYTRLEKQNFKIPMIKDKTIIIEKRELGWLMEGLDFSKIKGHKKLKYKVFY